MSEGERETSKREVSDRASARASERARGELGGELATNS